MHLKSRRGRIAANFLLAGLLAFAGLNGVYFFYDNLPVHSPCEDGATDYAWAPDTFYCRGTEGFAWGVTNNEGYMNTYDYVPGMPVDVLVMGASHMEASQIDMQKRMCARLDALLQDKTVYNIGISSHDLPICFTNFTAAVEKYAPQTVVIETSYVVFSVDELKSALTGTLTEKVSYSSGIIGMLQKIPFLRRIYHQIMSPREQIDRQNTTMQRKVTEQEQQLLAELLDKLSQKAENAGTQVIIAYHPPTTLLPDGTLYMADDKQAVDYFSAQCEQNGIRFLNMREHFQAQYEQNHVLPYGFSNTSVGSGHLNRYGHEMMAEELYKIIGGAA